MQLHLDSWQNVGDSFRCIIACFNNSSTSVVTRTSCKSSFIGLQQKHRPLRLHWARVHKRVIQRHNGKPSVLWRRRRLCYEWVILTANVCAALPYLQRIPGAVFHILLRMFKTSFQLNRHSFIIGLPTRRMCRRLNMSGISLVGVSLVILVPQLLQMNLKSSHTSNLNYSSSGTHSKSVLFHDTQYSSTYCSAWWIHQILFSDTLYCFLAM